VWEVRRLDEATAEWWRDWDLLNELSFNGHPLVDSVTVRTLCEYFGGSGLRTAVLRRGPKIAASLIIEPNGVGRWSVFCPAQSGIGLAVFDKAQPPSCEETRRLLSSVPGVGLAITFPYQDPLYSSLAGQSSSGIHRLELGTTMTVANVADFDRYWSERPKELRDNLRRRMTRAERDGLRVRVAMITAPDEIGAAVDRYALLESSGWKGKEGTALHPQNHQGAFYRGLFHELAEKQSALVSELYFNDRLVASRLLVSGPSMHVVLKTTHDEELRNYAPGHVQLYLLLRELLQGPAPRAIEFYTKATRDWLLWATDQRVMDTVTMYRNRWVANIAARRRSRSQADSISTAPELTHSGVEN
jgi:hypothetical protein